MTVLAALLLGATAWVRGNAWLSAPLVLALLWLCPPARAACSRPACLFGLLVASLAVHVATSFPYLHDELRRQLGALAPLSLTAVALAALLGAGLWLLGDRLLARHRVAASLASPPPRPRRPHRRRPLRLPRPARATVTAASTPPSRCSAPFSCSPPPPARSASPATPAADPHAVWLLALASVPVFTLALYAQRNLPHATLYYYGRYLVPELLPARLPARRARRRGCPQVPCPQGQAHARRQRHRGPGARAARRAARPLPHPPDHPPAGVRRRRACDRRPRRRDPRRRDRDRRRRGLAQRPHLQPDRRRPRDRPRPHRPPLPLAGGRLRRPARAPHRIGPSPATASPRRCSSCSTRPPTAMRPRDGAGDRPLAPGRRDRRSPPRPLRRPPRRPRRAPRRPPHPRRGRAPDPGHPRRPAHGPVRGPASTPPCRPSSAPGTSSTARPSGPPGLRVGATPGTLGQLCLDPERPLVSPCRAAWDLSLWSWSPGQAARAASAGRSPSTAGRSTCARPPAPVARDTLGPFPWPGSRGGSPSAARPSPDRSPLPARQPRRAAPATRPTAPASRSPPAPGPAASPRRSTSATRPHRSPGSPAARSLGPAPAPRPPRSAAASPSRCRAGQRLDFAAGICPRGQPRSARPRRQPPRPRARRRARACRCGTATEQLAELDPPDRHPGPWQSPPIAWRPRAPLAQPRPHPRRAPTSAPGAPARPGDLRPRVVATSELTPADR
jgi:hypothetical protein